MLECHLNNKKAPDQKFMSTLGCIMSYPYNAGEFI